MSGGRHLTDCRHCGAPIQLVLVIPTRIRRGTTRNYVPLDLVFDPATTTTPPSHGLSPGKTTCHPITAEFPLEGHETPAITHFATCPARRPASTAPEGTP